MNSNLKIIIVLICLSVLAAACSAGVALKDRPLKNGIVLRLEGSSALNRIKGRPHALRLFVYQLNDPKAFNKLASSKEGLRRLMEGDFSDQSVLSARLLPPLLPRQKVERRLDKLEGATHVAVVACYSFNISDKTTTGIFRLKFKKGLITFFKGVNIPEPLRVTISLGASRITGVLEEKPAIWKRGRKIRSPSTFSQPPSFADISKGGGKQGALRPL